MMENRIYTISAVIFSLAAYFTWHQNQEESELQPIELIKTVPEQLTELYLAGSTSTVTVTFRKDHQERFSWIQVESSAGKTGFLGNALFEDTLEDYAHLTAIRSLGILGGSILEQFALLTPKNTLRIRTPMSERIFELGRTTSGSQDVYAREKGKDEVFLLPRRLVSQLAAPQNRYMQRELQKSSLREVAGMTLQSGETFIRVIQHQRKTPKAAYWTFANTPSKPAPIIGNYVTKLRRLAAIQYLPELDIPGPQEALMKVNWLDDEGQSLEEILLFQVVSSDPVQYWAIASATRFPVRIHDTTAAQIVSDLRLLSSPRE
ncbi:MAG: DUF4340 domain-containing protein [Myxococcales bacterium]|nr:DUF4340 domain-containing protein [Myxococcales bacterium]